MELEDNQLVMLAIVSIVLGFVAWFVTMPVWILFIVVILGIGFGILPIVKGDSAGPKIIGILGLLFGLFNMFIVLILNELGGF